MTLFVRSFFRSKPAGQPFRPAVSFFFRTSFHSASIRPSNDMGKDKNKQLLKNPKGTRDWYGEDVDLLDDILSQIQRVFRKHASKKLDTPVFELQEVLKGKYGEDSKLIYDVADQGGELLSL